jgi:hypothetical protein
MARLTIVRDDQVETGVWHLGQTMNVANSVSGFPANRRSLLLSDGNSRLVEVSIPNISRSFPSHFGNEGMVSSGQHFIKKFVYRLSGHLCPVGDFGPLTFATEV